MEESITCPICKRDTPKQYQEEHHLIPRGISSRNKYAKLPQNQNGSKTVTVCNDCGNQIHLLFTEKELAEQYNSLDKLLSSQEVNKWSRWVSKQPISSRICNSRKK